MRNRALGALFGLLAVIGAMLLVAPISRSQLDEPGTPEPAPPPGQTRTLLPDGRVLVMGGMNGIRPRRSAQIIDPGTGEVLEIASALQHPRAWHTATVLPSGQIFVLGGVGLNQQFADQAEIFDYETLESKSLGDSGLSPRAYHTATLLTEGQVLIVGGESPSGEFLGTVELWDPKSGVAMTIPARFRSPRRNHFAILRRDGTVFIYGGLDPFHAKPTFVEIYDPERQTFHVEPWHSEKLKDTEEAYLEDSIPRWGASGVPLDTRVALRFSTLVDGRAAHHENIRLLGPQGPLPAKVVTAEEGRLVFVTPQTTLLPETTYQVTIEGLVDQEERGIPNGTVSFRTVEAPDDDEVWTPGRRNYKGDWTSGRANSPWQALPALQASSGLTALSGQVLGLHGRPIPNVSLEIAGARTHTDDTGRFLLTALSGGTHPLTIDGRTANTATKNYGTFIVKVDLTEGETNVLPYTVWMPLLDTDNAVALPSPTTREVIATTPLIPGLEVHVPQRAVLRDIDGNAVRSISITPIPIDRPPFPLPRGVKFPAYFTLQPGGAVLEGDEETLRQGIRLIMPNYAGAPAGSRVDLWSYDPTSLGWYVYGGASVSNDGKHIVPDSGVRIRMLTCAAFGPAVIAAALWSILGNLAWVGEPVDLGTGLFVYEKTDVVLPDVIPIVLTRTYRQSDPNTPRPFGMAASHSYAWFIIGDSEEFSYAELILADGSRVYYDRISEGTGYQDAVLEHTATPTIFYKSQLTFVGGSWRIELKDGTRFYFFKEPIPRLTKIEDRLGNVMTFDYASGEISKITSPNNRWIELSYNTDGFIGSITDNIGRSVLYQYDSYDRLWKVTDMEGHITEHSYYGSSDRMHTIKDGRGVTFLTNEYDPVNYRITKQTLGDPSNVFLFDYTEHPTTEKIIEAEVTDPRGYVRHFEFNADGYVTSDTLAQGTPEGQTVTYEREAGSNFILSVTDSLNNRKTRFVYDASGNITDVTLLDGQPGAVTTHIDYEPDFSLISAITDPLDHTTSFGYDLFGQLTRVTDPLLNQWSLEYDSSHQLAAVVDANLARSELRYELGDLVEVTDPLGNTTRVVLDGGSRVVSITDAAGGVTRYGYDDMNHLLRVTDASGGVTELTYDANGNPLSIKDARLKTTSYTYDNNNRLQTRTDALQDPVNSVET